MHNLSILQEAWLAAGASEIGPMQFDFGSFAATVYPPDFREPKWLCVAFGGFWQFDSFADCFDWIANYAR